MAEPSDLNSFAESVNDGSFLKAKFPQKDWHEHRRTDGRTDWCDGTPSDCNTKARVYR